MAQYGMPSDQTLIPRGLMWAGAGLMVAAAALGVAGSGVFAAATVIGLRRHQLATGLPPSKLAIHHWRRAKTAARVGADSWRAQHPGAVPAQVSMPRQAAPVPVS
jgi:hypothetical protein